MLNSWENLTKYPLRWVWIGGLHPDYNSKFAKCHFVFNFLYFGLVLVLAMMAIMMSYKDNLYNTIDGILTIFLYLHIMGKFALAHHHKATLAQLLAERSKFWSLDDIDGNIRHECQSLIKTALTVIKFYLGYSCLVASSYLIQPFVTGQLPVFLYVPQGWYYFLVISFCYLTPSIISSIWGVDTIFFSISILVSVQLKLLTFKFENLNLVLTNAIDRSVGHHVREKFYALVDYHNFLNWYCKTINKMSSGVLLIQFLVAIAISCMQLFIASQKEFNLLNKFKCLSYFIMQIVETAIYCYTAELISETTAAVGTAVYKSPWYDVDSNPLKKDLNMVIVRSQKAITLNGLGLVKINMETFTQVFKTALSFYTYLNTMVYS